MHESKLQNDSQTYMHDRKNVFLEHNSITKDWKPLKISAS